MSVRLDAVSLHERLRARQPRVYVTCALIVANVLVFLAMYASGARLGLTPSEVHLRWGANFGPATQDGEWWRLGSAMFLHFGVLHLAMNAWALWDGGQLVERMTGPLRFALIYLVSGVSGNLLSLDISRGSAVTGGASGAIFGIYGALLIYLWHERRALDPREFRWMFWGAAIFSATVIVLGFVVTGIDNAAHVGGFLTGLLCAVLLGDRARAWSVWRSAATVALASIWFALLVCIPPAPYRWRDEASARAEIGRFLENEAAVKKAWAEILDESAQGSFEDLAGQVETRIADTYERSFERLSQLPVPSTIPSAPDLEALRSYAAARRDVSRRLAEALRANDPARIREALREAGGATPTPRAGNPRPE